ncbi:pentatricopeptide repeat-containing protein [Cinnamomum micranthum f. kanehirae]|uniref:Pentatricopeptide repeat-containing protein n=1 Tax=Cinnamomum micranthum f. kanehirae TaxID=337451 RepID=A0A443NDA5_9MAGN|nr:pentatricopeptide repeat-containing protein [Cinnamomum micranthum f. kanehirae]
MLLFYCSRPLPQAHTRHLPTFSSSFATLLQDCKSLSETRLLHQQILSRGLLHSHLLTRIVAAYLGFDSPSDALAALERHSPTTAVFWWNALIRYHVRHSNLNAALSVFRRMVTHGTRPDHFTFPFVLKACGE